MPELRQNRVSGEWVIIAAERAGRPGDHKTSVGRPKLPDFSARCPFCPGNEKMTPPESYAIRKKGGPPDSEGWQVRIVPNKYPALDPTSTADWFEEERFFNGIQGFGVHDVIIDSPKHDLTIATMTTSAVEKVFVAYRERFRQLEKHEQILLINIFRNYGLKAGASLEHPHSQLIATPVIPTRIQMRLNIAKEYFQVHGRCVVCDLVERSLIHKKRIVLETERFVVLEPFASQSPYETWVIPKRHEASFGETTNEEIRDLASVMRDILGRIYSGLGDPDYNYLIQTSPTNTRYWEKYHWYVQILPRVVPSVGFEITSGIYISTARPEDTAEYLRQIGPWD